MTEQCTVARSEDGGEASTVLQDRRMSYRIDIPVHPMQTPCTCLMRDRVLGITEPGELAARHDPVLLLRKVG